MLTAIVSGFAAALAAPWLHRRRPKAAPWILAAVPAAAAAAFGVALFSGDVLRSAIAWVPALGVELSFRGDGLGLLFAVLVTGLGSLVAVYAGAYFEGKPEAGRFLLLLLAFMASMLGVVLADHLVVLFVFWELTSLWSYLLIGFHAERKEARDAALRALVVTELGGLALLAGLVLLASAGGSWELSALAERGERIRAAPAYPAIVALVLAGAFAKSAQVPFHFWLPDAMEAPTPASAYLHAATLVKAGLYLLFRLEPALGGSELWRTLLLGAGAASFLLGAWLALRQRDLKRLLAYSTVSSLGAVVLLLGLGATAPALAYLTAHALYKGALFLVAGAVDHQTGERSLDRLGGLRRAMPLTAAAAALAGLSMASLPPTLGFLAKEMFYEAALASWIWAAVSVAANALLFAATLSMVLGTFGGSPRSPAPREAAFALWAAPLLLGAAGVALGLAPSVLEAVVAKEVALWHGFTPALGLSALTAAAGLGAYALRGRLGRGGGGLGSRAFDALLRGLNAGAKAQTAALQNGSLPAYTLTTVGVLLLGPGLALLWRSGAPSWPAFDAPWLDVGISLLIAAAALAATLLRTMLGAVAAMGAAGYGIALLFLLHGAPDLAMTQFVVESLVVILFVSVFRKLPGKPARPRPRGREFVVAVGSGALMAALVLAVQPGPPSRPASAFFLAAAEPLAKGRNVVNAILVDFRAIDTLGEIAVLMTAAAGAYALLRPSREGG